MSEVTPDSTLNEDDNLPTYDVLTTVQQAIGAQPVDFEQSVKGLLADRLVSALERKREEIARSMFSGEVQVPDTDDQDAVEDEDETAGESELDNEKE